VGTPVQLALPALLEAGAGVRAQIQERARGNLRLLRDTLAGSPASALHVEGGWYAVIQMPRTRTEEEWATMLLGQGVLVQPGYFFDFETEAFVVVSLLTPTDVFREGVELIRARVR
jgi:DNA-binding transcriptional MocR family regulator